MDDINTEQYMKSIQWSVEAQCRTRKQPKRVEICKGANSYVTLADWRRGYDLKARVL